MLINSRGRSRARFGARFRARAGAPFCARLSSLCWWFFSWPMSSSCSCWFGWWRVTTQVSSA